MDENWLPIPGYEDYEVSDQGRVRSLERSVRSRWGTPKALKARVLKQPSQGRYFVVTLYRDRKPKCCLVHRLVLLAFRGPCPDGHEGLHFDDDPTNNRLDNLRWGTRSENAKDCLRNGNHWRGNATHCPNGHERTTENTYVAPSTSYRYCRACALSWRESKKTRPHPRDRTQCPQGHPYNEENTAHYAGRRVCRICSRERSRKHDRRKRLLTSFEALT